MKKRNKNNGSTNDNWATPDYILKDIEKEFGKFFDPCPLNHDKSKWDGLKISWRKVNFINPPYNNKDKVAFIRKAYEESLKGKTCILLIPVTTDIPIFHELIWPYGEIRYIKGRVKFKGYNSKGEYVDNKSGQSGSMFVIFRTVGTIIKSIKDKEKCQSK